MPRITKPLTDTQIRNAKPKDKVFSLFDGNGLVLKVQKSGSKKWVFEFYKPFTKSRTSMSFGNYPDISLVEARKLRSEAKALLAKDINPQEHREKARLQNKQALQHTVRNVTEAWFNVKKTKISSDYAEDIINSLTNHIFPTLSKVPISALTAPKVIKVLQPIAAKGTLETVKRLCQRLNEIMNFAVNTGLIDTNPLSGIKDAFASPKKKLLPTIQPSELPELVENINEASIKKVTRILLLWQLHTMVRPSEAACAKWSEIDLENQVWVIPAERMKMKREHIVPLTHQSTALLEKIKPISGHREYIFPSDRNPRTHCNTQTANAALKRMGYHNKLVAHGFRALASTVLNEEGFDPDLIESALAHQDGNEVRRAYNRTNYLERRRKVMNWWSANIVAAKNVYD